MQKTIFIIGYRNHLLQNTEDQTQYLHGRYEDHCNGRLSHKKENKRDNRFF